MELKIPTREDAILQEASWGLKDVLRFFSFDDFVFILLAILKEKSIVFVSTQLALISACIMTFVGIIKPFNWPYPLIHS